MKCIVIIRNVWEKGEQNAIRNIAENMPKTVEAVVRRRLELRPVDIVIVENVEEEDRPNKERCGA